MLTASAGYKIQSASIDTFICGDLFASPTSYPFLSLPLLPPPRSLCSTPLSLSFSRLDPIGGNVFVGLIYLCRNICMYMEPTLYPHLARGSFTKCACIGARACEITYVVVKIMYVPDLENRYTNVGVRSGRPNFPATRPRDR